MKAEWMLRVLRFYDERRVLGHSESSAAIAAAMRLTRVSCWCYSESMELLKQAMIERRAIPTRSGELL